jgi:hypothetical protein
VENVHGAGGGNLRTAVFRRKWITPLFRPFFRAENLRNRCANAAEIACVNAASAPAEKQVKNLRKKAGKSADWL